jgi:hypothetical protein
MNKLDSALTEVSLRNSYYCPFREQSAKTNAVVVEGV